MRARFRIIAVHHSWNPTLPPETPREKISFLQRFQGNHALAEHEYKLSFSRDKWKTELADECHLNVPPGVVTPLQAWAYIYSHDAVWIWSSVIFLLLLGMSETSYALYATPFVMKHTLTDGNGGPYDHQQSADWPIQRRHGGLRMLPYAVAPGPIWRDRGEVYTVSKASEAKGLRQKVAFLRLLDWVTGRWSGVSNGRRAQKEAIQKEKPRVGWIYFWRMWSTDLYLSFTWSLLHLTTNHWFLLTPLIYFIYFTSLLPFCALIIINVFYPTRTISLILFFRQRSRTDRLCTFSVTMVGILKNFLVSGPRNQR